MSNDIPPPLPGGFTAPRAARLDESPLQVLVSSSRKWMRLGGIGRLLLWLSVAVCAALAADLILSLAPTTRAVLGGIILVGAALLVIRHLFLRPRAVTLETATTQVEAAHPEIGQLLRTARETSRSASTVSPVLKNELLRRAAVQLAGMDLTKLRPRRPAGKWLAAGTLALLGCAIFLSANREAPVAFARLLSPFSGITYTTVRDETPDPTFDRNRLPRIVAHVTGRIAEEVTIQIPGADGDEMTYAMNPLGGGRYEVTLPASSRSFEFRILAGDSQPAIGTMECVDPAEFVSSSAEVTLPEYTGQATVNQDSADIDAVEGTRASLHFTMSAPMAEATLTLPTGARIPLTVDGNQLSTTLEVKTGGESAELTGIDARGHAILPTRFGHKGFPDTLPVVEWIEPTKDIDATAVAEIPLRLRVKDDFGVASYGVVLQVQAETKDVMTRVIEARDLRDLSEMTTAALESFPLTIRDNVRIYAWATDHKPRGEARAVSEIRSVDIKPFKRKWQMLSGVMKGMPISQEDLMDVEKLIKGQREILSDAFSVIQGASATDVALSALAGRETQLQQDGAELHVKVEEAGEWPADDINLLAAAVNQMGESAAAWYAVEPQPGFDRGDAALSTLLELRKNLLTLLMKADCPCLEPKPEEIPNELTDLAKEAERLAKEERDVAGQLTNAPDSQRLAAIRRQQDVANSDTGELHARLMDHPESTPLILSHMADAEQLVRNATRSTRSGEAVNAAPPQLQDAATALDGVAKHLRALDEANMDQTLAEMADEAKKAAEAAKPKPPAEKPTDKPQEQAGDKPGEKPGEKPGAGEKPAQAAGEKPGKKPGEGPGEGKSEQAGQGKGEGKGKGQGSGQGEGAAESGQAENGDGKSPGGQGEGELASNDADAGNNPSGTGTGAGNAPSPTEGEDATPGNDSGKDPETERREVLAKAARQAATNDDILKFFAERESEAGKDSRFDALREKTGSADMEQQLKDTAAGKSDGAETAEDLKKLAAALEQEREFLRQSRLETLAKAREQAEALKKQAEARRDAARKVAREIAKTNEGGFSFDIPKEVLDAAKKAQGNNGKPGDKPGDSPGEGAPSNGPGQTTAVQELARSIEALKDPELSRIAKALEQSAPDLADVKPLAAAERRLAAMIAEISGLARANGDDGTVPPAYRRAVEDYYRALSDDFGDEDPATH